jgi:hypothetical protein
MERRSGKGMGNGCEEEDKKGEGGIREGKWSGSGKGRGRGCEDRDKKGDREYEISNEREWDVL